MKRKIAAIEVGIKLCGKVGDMCLVFFSFFVLGLQVGRLELFAAKYVWRGRATCVRVHALLRHCRVGG